MRDILYIAGSLASILGALVAWWQAFKAVGAKRAVEQYKTSIDVVQSSNSYQAAYEVCIEINQSLYPYKSDLGYQGIEKDAVKTVCAQVREGVRRVDIHLSKVGQSVNEVISIERIESHIEGLENAKRVDESIRWIKEISRDLSALEIALQKYIQNIQNKIEKTIAVASVSKPDG